MTEERERHLVNQIGTLKCMGQIEGFRAMMAEQKEEPTTAIFKALIEQQDRINRK